jgi:hypothetical protein
MLKCHNDENNDTKNSDYAYHRGPLRPGDVFMESCEYYALPTWFHGVYFGCMVRMFFEQWWFDTSALALGQEYRGFTLDGRKDYNAWFLQPVSMYRWSVLAE